MPRYDDDEDERPRSRRQRDRDEFEDEDERPRRRSRRDEVDEDEERPSRRRSRYQEDDVDDDRPRRRSRRRESQENPAAGISLTLGLLSILLNVITGIPAIVFGIIGFQKAGRTGNGKGMALAGIGSAVVCSAISAYGIYFFWNMRSERQADNKSINNGKQIGLAMHSHHDVFNRFPAAYTAPGYVGNMPAPPEFRRTSWRTNILPFVEQDNLFRQYDQLQPWNSPRNQMVTNAVVPVYDTANAKTNQTRYRVFTGPQTPFPHGQPPIGFMRMTDGTSNTILMAESAELGPWGEPKDMEIPPFGAWPQLGDPAKKDALILMADGSVRTVRKNIPENVLRLLVDPADGQPVPFDW